MGKEIITNYVKHLDKSWVYEELTRKKLALTKSQTDEIMDDLPNQWESLITCFLTTALIQANSGDVVNWLQALHTLKSMQAIGEPVPVQKTTSSIQKKTS